MQRSSLQRLCVLVALIFPSVPLFAQASSDPLVVHEWGTFTSLQDETGRAIGGINTDDEPVPPFVHRLSNFLLLSPTEVPRNFFQGAPACHPDVTMRLETPVLYFHLPAVQPMLRGIAVTAQFRGGWLTEFYPRAHAHAPGVNANRAYFGPLNSHTTSTLTWSNLDVWGDASGPPTTEHVWTAPRAVRATAVRTAEGEVEKFLFYRGVGHVDAPLVVARVPDTSQLELRSQWPSAIAGQPPSLQSLWLVDIDAAGRVAFAALPSFVLGAEPLRVRGKFAAGEYSEARRDELKASLHQSLMAEGLFDDEAQALLDTWELSYFKSAGTRVFFIVPRQWTDFYLPLSLSAPAQITRVMVGRIELVTPAQRETLRDIAQRSAREIITDMQRLRRDYDRLAGARSWKDVASGRESLQAFGVSVPESYQRYLSLGRFRNALILDEASKRATPGLNSFISAYQLEGYRPR